MSPTSHGATPSPTSTEGDSPTATPTTAADCPASAPLADGDRSTSLVVLREGGQGGPRVEAAVYPRPERPGNPWSQWGQGVVLPDGRFLSAIGDHRGHDGNAFLFEYDPRTGRLALATDVATAISGGAGWGAGKVHADLVLDGCQVLLTTYWGDRSVAQDIDRGGDHLLRYDPAERTLIDLGVPLTGHGLPSIGGWPDGGLVYAEAVDPDSSPDGGAFVVWDTEQGEATRVANSIPHVGFRDVLVDGRGVAYFSAGDRRLHRYDPATDAIGNHDAALPGRWLRASTPAAPDGTVYGVTREPDVLFALEPSGEIRSLGRTRGYVASLAVAPDGSALYYIPDAHGGSWRQGTPVVRVDTATGAEEVIVELHPLVLERFGLRLGGTYNVVMEPSGDRLFIGLNAGEPPESFGEVVLVIVELP